MAAYNPDGVLAATRTVFDPAFTGGVRTATADFNGDGVPDLVVGTGPGAASLVEVIDGKSGAVLFSVAPFEPGFTGGVFVAAGDLTGDGAPDLVITPDVGGGPRVRVYDGKDFGLAADFLGIEDPDFRGGARAAVGDLNGGGRADLVAAAGFGGGPRVAAFDGRTLTSGSPQKLFGDVFVFEPSLRNGAYVAVVGVNGDGFGDPVLGGGPGGGPRVLVLSGADLTGGRADSPTTLANFFAGDPGDRSGVRVAAKNLDGDSRADLVVDSGQGAGARAVAYLGKNLTASGAPPAAFEVDPLFGSVGGVFVG